MQRVSVKFICFIIVYSAMPLILSGQNPWQGGFAHLILDNLIAEGKAKPML